MLAVDLNPACNATYEHNFGIKPVQKQVESLSVDYIRKLHANCWLMSPPCQPYTRTSKQLDTNDNRATGLMYLIEILPKVTPDFIFLENVVGFEGSDSRKMLVETIVRLGFQFTEWIISPTQLGIPNNRPRYYLTASRVIDMNLDRKIPIQPINREWNRNELYEPGQKRIRDYVNYGFECGSLNVPMDFLKKKASVDFFMICKPEDITSKCFTKAYGRYGHASGGYLQTKGFDITNIEGLLENPVLALETLGLRYFSPMEIAKLHGFPDSFEFPPSITLMQQWKCLGNSMNIAVVAEILFAALKNSFRDEVKI